MSNEDLRNDEEVVEMLEELNDEAIKLDESLANSTEVTPEIVDQMIEIDDNEGIVYDMVNELAPEDEEIMDVIE